MPKFYWPLPFLLLLSLLRRVSVWLNWKQRKSEQTQNKTERDIPSATLSIFDKVSAYNTHDPNADLYIEHLSFLS